LVNQAVKLTCSNLPSESTCDFSASTVPVGGGATTFKLSTLAPATADRTAYNQTSASLP
jgi:hypothetical protein